MAVIAIAPPTRMATIGTRYGPKFTMESKILSNRRLPQGLKPISFGPLNAALKGRSSTHFSHNSGGADRDRTGGLLVANQALSQLSYSPNPSCQLPVVSKSY